MDTQVKNQLNSKYQYLLRHRACRSIQGMDVIGVLDIIVKIERGNVTSQFVKVLPRQ